VRLAGSSVSSQRGTITDVTTGSLTVADGMMAEQPYEVRTRLVTPGLPSDWTSWTAVTTGAARLGTDDLAAGAVNEIFQDYVASIILDPVSQPVHWPYLPATGFDFQAHKVVSVQVRINWIPPAGAASNQLLFSLTRRYNGPTSGIVENTVSFRHTLHAGSAHPVNMWATLSFQQIFGPSPADTVSEWFRLDALCGTSGDVLVYESWLQGIVLRK
jgi:hypothetical protein